MKNETAVVLMNHQLATAESWSRGREARGILVYCVAD
jgi:hypothetical protein